MLQQKLDAAVAQAQASWKRDEDLRLLAETTRLEEQFANRLAEREMRVQAMAEIASEQQAAALRMMRQEFAATKDALAARDSELAASRAQMERLRKDWEAEIVSTKATLQAKTGEALKSAEAEWAARLDKAQADLKAMREAADAAAAKARKDGETELAALRGQIESQRTQSQAENAAAKAMLESKVAEAIKTAQAGARADHDGEIARLRAEMERQHQQAQGELAAANAAAAEQLKKAEAEWQARSDKALAELADNQAAGASDLRAHRDNRVAELGAELERLRQQTQSEIAAARAEGEAKAAEQLKIAEAEWKEQSDKAMTALATRQASTGTTDLRAHRDNRVAELGAELERQRLQSETEIAGVKAAADFRTAQMLKAAEAEWQKRSNDALTAMTARLEAAEAALAAANAATPDRDEEVRHLQGQVEYLQKWSEAEIAALQVAAATRETQMLKDAEAKWQAQSDAALALANARCDAAEAALAAADPRAPLAERDSEIEHLRLEIARQAQTAEADMAAAKAAADIAAGEKLKAAQVIWEQETAGALAKANARFDAAEAALEAERRAAAGRANEDEYVHSLEREIKTLRATLVDREAAIVQTQAMQEQMRLGTMREGPGTRWQPLTSNRVADDEPRQSEKQGPNRQLLRDVGVVVMVAAAAVLLLPKLELMLPNAVRWQIETVGGMFLPAETKTAPAAPVAAAASQPKAEHPTLYAIALRQCARTTFNLCRHRGQPQARRGRRRPGNARQLGPGGDLGATGPGAARVGIQYVSDRYRSDGCSPGATCRRDAGRSGASTRPDIHAGSANARSRARDAAVCHGIGARSCANNPGIGCPYAIIQTGGTTISNVMLCTLPSLGGASSSRPRNLARRQVHSKVPVCAPRALIGAAVSQSPVRVFSRASSSVQFAAVRSMKKFIAAIGATGAMAPFCQDCPTAA